METVLEHRIEPPVAAPPPRLARLPWSTTALLLGAALLLLSFVFGSVRALLEAGQLVWLGAAGRTVTARVTQANTEVLPKGAQSPQRTRFQYSFTSPRDSSLRVGSAIQYSVPPPVDNGPLNAPPPRKGRPAIPLPPPPPKVGDTFPLRVAPWFGRLLYHPWQQPPVGKMLLLFLAGALVAGVSLLLLRRLLRWHQGRLHLLRNGLATVGTVVHKHAQTEDSVRYFLRFGYASEPDGQARETEEQVSADSWRSFEVGQPVTVLYDPAQPEQASLYALMGRK